MPRGGFPLKRAPEAAGQDPSACANRAQRQDLRGERYLGRTGDHHLAEQIDVGVLELLPQPSRRSMPGGAAGLTGPDVTCCGRCWRPMLRAADEDGAFVGIWRVWDSGERML